MTAQQVSRYSRVMFDARPATALHRAMNATPDEVATLEALTTELRPPLPAVIPPRLQALLYVHLRVTSRRHRARVASPDGTVHHFPDGPMMRVRTAELTPVPPLERVPCWGAHGDTCPHYPLERTPRQ